MSRAKRRFWSALAALILGLSASPASAASIGFNSTVDASDLSGPLLFTLPGTPFGDIPVNAYNAFDNGQGTATFIDGFTSLIGVDPSDVTFVFGDVERLDTVFAPPGCVPTPPPGFTNCATAVTTYGDLDANPSFFNIELAGVGTILSGVSLTVVNLLVTDETSPDFATATAVGASVITGGISPYLDEALALTGGTGLVQIETEDFDPVCFPGTDPCTFEASGVATFVPEPSTALLVVAGLAALSIARRAARGR